MSKDPFASPLDDSSDRRSFYMNGQRREALATLRYGIVARKGLILLTGDAGTGKSTLLRELEREWGDDVTCALIADPRATFADMVRAALNRLQTQTVAADEPTLIQQGLAVLRSHVERGRLIAVILDEAHHVDDRELELAVQKLIGASPEKSHTGLAQIILAGRPELKERLFRPPLRSLGSMVAIECKLAALTAKEVGEYITHRLRNADLEAGLFDNDAIQRVASYSDGKLGLINAVCDRALRMAGASPRKTVDAKMIDAAAKDLNLWQPRWVRKDSQPKPADDFIMPREREGDESFQFRFASEDTTETVGQTFLHLSGSKANRPWFGARGTGGKSRTGIVVLAAAILAVPGIWLYGEGIKNSLTESRIVIGGIIDGYLQRPSPSDTVRVIERAEPKQPDGIYPAPLPEPLPPPTIKDPEPMAIPSGKIEENPVPPPPPVPAKRVESAKRKIPSPAIARAKQIPQEPPGGSRDDLAKQVSKAIENRAIDGVSVTVKDNIIYLDGRVATERQRRAAENAARDVGDVAGLRNRIAVE